MPSSEMPSVKALVVCLGNICRSPMGEAILKATAADRGLPVVVDSCGTASYHVGDDPDTRSVATCKKHGIAVDHVGRQIATADFTTFTHILAADKSNLASLEKIKPKNATAVVRLWGSYLDDKPIPDPYYGGINGFENNFEQCKALSDAFLDATFGSK